MSGLRMVRLGENAWIRADQIESVKPWDVDITNGPSKGWTEYRVLVQLLSGRTWHHTVASAETYRYNDEAKAAKENGKAERDEYLNNLLMRMVAG